MTALSSLGDLALKPSPFTPQNPLGSGAACASLTNAPTCGEVLLLREGDFLATNESKPTLCQVLIEPLGIRCAVLTKIHVHKIEDVIDYLSVLRTERHMLAPNALGISAFGTLSRFLFAPFAELRRLVVLALPTGNLGGKFAVLVTPA